MEENTDQMIKRELPKTVSPHIPYKIKNYYYIPIILGLIIIIYSGIYFLKVKGFIKTQKQNSVIPTNSQSNMKAGINQITDYYTIPVLREYDSHDPADADGSNLWLYNDDMKHGKQITSDHKLSGIFQISPDKKNILVQTFKVVNGFIDPQMGIININSGKILQLFPVYNDKNDSIWDADWLDNDNIIYALGRQIKIFNIKSRSEEILVNSEKSITDSSIISFLITPDRHKIVYYYTYFRGRTRILIGKPQGVVQQDLNVYVLNLENKKVTRLFSYSDPGYPQMALYDDFIVYNKRVDKTNQILKISYSASGSKFITSLPEGDLVSLINTNSQGELIYLLDNFTDNILHNFNQKQWYSRFNLYDFRSKQTKTLYELNSGWIEEPVISSNGNSILFKAQLDTNKPMQYSVVNYNLITNKSAVLVSEEKYPNVVKY